MDRKQISLFKTLEIFLALGCCIALSFFVWVHPTSAAIATKGMMVLGIIIESL